MYHLVFASALGDFYVFESEDIEDIKEMLRRKILNKAIAIAKKKRIFAKREVEHGS